MFANWPNGSYYPTALLLGSVVIQTNVQQVVPSYTTVKGYAPFSFSGLGGTIIQATTSFPSSTAVVEMGAPSIAYAVKISHISADCVEAGTSTALTGGIGVENQYAEENSSLDSIQTTGCLTGVYVHGTAASQSGPYSNLTMNDQDIAATPDASYRCLQIGDSSSNVILQSNFSKISCGGGDGAGTPAVLIGIDAYAVRVSDVHLETGGIGIQIGGVHFARSIVLQDIDCSTGIATTCVDMPVSAGSDTESLYSIASTISTNLLVDHQTNGCTQTVAADDYLGFYSRGSEGPNYGNQVITNSTTCSSFFGNIGSATAASGTAPTIATSGGTQASRDPCGCDQYARDDYDRNGAATQATLTFASPAFSATPYCQVTEVETTTTLPTANTIAESTSSTASAVVFNFPSQASLKFNYLCLQ